MFGRLVVHGASNWGPAGSVPNRPVPRSPSLSACHGTWRRRARLWPERNTTSRGGSRPRPRSSPDESIWRIADPDGRRGPGIAACWNGETRGFLLGAGMVTRCDHREEARAAPPSLPRQRWIIRAVLRRCRDGPPNTAKSRSGRSRARFYPVAARDDRGGDMGRPWTRAETHVFACRCPPERPCRRR